MGVKVVAARRCRSRTKRGHVTYRASLTNLAKDRLTTTTPRRLPPTDEGRSVGRRLPDLKMAYQSNAGIMAWATSMRLNMANDPGRQYVEDQIQEKGFKFLDDYLAMALEGPKDESVHSIISLSVC